MASAFYGATLHGLALWYTLRVVNMSKEMCIDSDSCRRYCSPDAQGERNRVSAQSVFPEN